MRLAMTNELIQAYTLRVSQASRSELVVIMYEIILTDLQAAKNAYSEGDNATYIKELKQAQRFLNELMGTLDYTYRLSYELMSLYIYVNKAIITALFKKVPVTLDSAVSVLQKLMEGFKEISKTDTSGPVMQNTQQLYAGLTYGKGSLNEVSIDPREQNRGYKV
jgi:flagellar protein FliS